MTKRVRYLTAALGRTKVLDLLLVKLLVLLEIREHTVDLLSLLQLMLLDSSSGS